MLLIRRWVFGFFKDAHELDACFFLRAFGYGFLLFIILDELEEIIASISLPVTYSKLEHTCVCKRKSRQKLCF